jgi:hypothetical protein
MFADADPTGVIAAVAGILIAILYAPDLFINSFQTASYLDGTWGFPSFDLKRRSIHFVYRPGLLTELQPVAIRFFNH